MSAEVSPELAQLLVDLITAATGHEVIVCAGEGAIIAATLRERIGTRHEGARRILAGEVDEIAITPEEERRWQGVRQGYNCPVEIEGRRACTVGIRGDPQLVKPLARVAARMMGAEVEISRQAQALRQDILGQVREVVTAAQQIAVAARSLESLGGGLRDQARIAGEHLAQTNRVLEFIRTVAVRTKLLGLNALIEAAHAGEQGRGFAVVAEEIRKLADHSATSVKEILGVLENIGGTVEEMTTRIAEVAAIATQQSTATGQIAERMHLLEEAVERLAVSRAPAASQPGSAGVDGGGPG
ncbi:MAG: sugar diacid recognition domain-containing protein [Bacillota bacterium]